MTPVALMAALRQAGTTVCEPIYQFNLEIPSGCLATVLPVLSQLRATPQTTEVQGTTCRLRGTIPTARLHELQQQLPGLSSGESVLETTFDSYRPVSGLPPQRE